MDTKVSVLPSTCVKWSCKYEAISLQRGKITHFQFISCFSGSVIAADFSVREGSFTRLELRALEKDIPRALEKDILTAVSYWDALLPPLRTKLLRLLPKSTLSPNQFFRNHGLL